MRIIDNILVNNELLINCALYHELRNRVFETDTAEMSALIRAYDYFKTLNWKETTTNVIPDDILTALFEGALIELNTPEVFNRSIIADETPLSIKVGSLSIAYKDTLRQSTFPRLEALLKPYLIQPTQNYTINITR